MSSATEPLIVCAVILSRRLSWSTDVFFIYLGLISMFVQSVIL